MNLFLDTQVLVTNNFDFLNSRMMKSLKKCSQHDLINLYITEITYKESIRRIEENVKLAHESLKSIKKNTRIMNNLESFRRLMDKDSDTEHIQYIKDSFDNYIKESGIEIIQIDSVESNRLIDPYFSKLPPFNKPTKKHEFPDTISLLTIEKWIKDNNSSVTVISGDGDFEDLISTLGIERITYFDNLKPVLDSLHPDLQFKEFLSSHTEDIIKKIHEQFSSIYISTDYYDGEVQGQNLYDVTIHDISLIDVDDDISYISVKVDLDFDVEMSFPDPDGIYWDSETKSPIYVGDTQYKSISESTTVDIEFECEKIDNEEPEWDLYPLEYSLSVNTDEYNDF